MKIRVYVYMWIDVYLYTSIVVYKYIVQDISIILK